MTLQYCNDNVYDNTKIHKKLLKNFPNIIKNAYFLAHQIQIKYYSNIIMFQLPKYNLKGYILNYSSSKTLSIL
jgi:hypothetical protein